MNIEELLAAAVAEMDDDQLAAHTDALRQAGVDTLADPTDENIALARRIQEALTAADAETTTRTEDAERRSTEAAELLSQFAGPEPEAEDPETPEPEAEDPETPEGEDPEAVVPEVPEAEVTPIAAAAPAAPRVSRVAARRPAASTPRPTATRQMALTASANVPGIAAGTPLDSPELIARAFDGALNATKNYRGGDRSQLSVMQLGVMDASDLYGEERTLRTGGGARENTRKVNAIASPQALRASGGICAPPPIQYAQPTVGSTARPFRDGLARFGADRGGIRTLALPTLTDLDGSVDVWTNANDLDPGGEGLLDVKPCLQMTCPDDNETLVEAITKCLQIGNFRAQYFPEQVAAWVQQASVVHARFAEGRLLTAVAAGSTQVTTGQLLGTTRDVLAALDRAVAAWESRWRLENVMLRWAVPAWLIDNMRADLVREMPGSTDERLASADAYLAGLFAVRGIQPIYLLDGESGQVFGAQGDGPLLGWPTSAVTYLFEEGTWLYLDGGTLDFGIVRDSVLNGTNDMQMFSETFEGAHFFGRDSMRITMDICPSGEAAALTSTAALCSDFS